jgi:hypothetical protein
MMPVFYASILKMETKRTFRMLYQIVTLLESPGVADSELKFCCSLQREIFHSLGKDKEAENKLVRFVNP